MSDIHLTEYVFNFNFDSFPDERIRQAAKMGVKDAFKPLDLGHHSDVVCHSEIECKAGTEDVDEL